MTLESCGGDSETAHFDLTLQILDTEQGLTAALVYKHPICLEAAHRLPDAGAFSELAGGHRLIQSSASRNCALDRGRAAAIAGGVGTVTRPGVSAGFCVFINSSRHRWRARRRHRRRVETEQLTMRS